jgi:hypothetical protein
MATEREIELAILTYDSYLASNVNALNMPNGWVYDPGTGLDLTGTGFGATAYMGPENHWVEEIRTRCAKSSAASARVAPREPYPQAAACADRHFWCRARWRDSSSGRHHST